MNYEDGFRSTSGLLLETKTKMELKTELEGQNTRNDSGAF